MKSNVSFERSTRRGIRLACLCASVIPPLPHITIKVTRPEEFIALVATSVAMRGSDVPRHGCRIYVNVELVETPGMGFEELVMPKDLKRMKKENEKYVYVGTWFATVGGVVRV